MDQTVNDNSILFSRLWGSTVNQGYVQWQITLKTTSLMTQVSRITCRGIPLKVLLRTLHNYQIGCIMHSHKKLLPKI